MRVRKLVQEMLRNPRAITRHEDLLAVADHFGVRYRRGGRHPYVFYREGKPNQVTVPHEIKAYVVKQFLELIWDLIPEDWLS